MGKFRFALIAATGLSLLYACTSDDSTSSTPGDAGAPTSDSGNTTGSDSGGTGSDASSTSDANSDSSSDASNDAAPPTLTTDSIVCTLDGVETTFPSIGTCIPTGVAAYIPPAGSTFTVGFAANTGTQTCAADGGTGSLVYGRKPDGGGAATTFIAGSGFSTCTVNVTSVGDGGTGSVNAGTFSGVLQSTGSAGSVTATNCAYRCTM